MSIKSHFSNQTYMFIGNMSIGFYNDSPALISDVCLSGISNNEKFDASLLLELENLLIIYPNRSLTISKQ